MKVRKGIKGPIHDQILRKKLVIDKIIPPFDATTVAKPGASSAVSGGGASSGAAAAPGKKPEMYEEE